MDERRIEGVLEGFLAPHNTVSRVGVVIFAGVGLSIGAQPAAVHALLFQS